MDSNRLKKSGGGKAVCSMCRGIIPLSPPHYSGMYEWYDAIFLHGENGGDEVGEVTETDKGMKVISQSVC
jgi:hypothetical protein